MMSIINQNVYIMEKIEVLNGVVKEFGLTAEAVVKSWYENNQISAEFLQQLCPVGGKTTFQDVNLIPSKKFVTPKKIEPGMFYYADGLIFPELIKDSQVSAIVGCVDRNHGLALGLRETVLPWSSGWLYVDMSCRLSGEEATALILKTAKEKHKKRKQPSGVQNMLLTALKPVRDFCRVKMSLSVFSAIGKNCANHLRCLIPEVCPEIVC